MSKPFRPSVLALLAFALTALASAQLQTPQSRSSTTNSVPTRQAEITVKVSWENDRPVSDGLVRIQLTNQMGVSIAETYVRDGEARFPNISPGQYKFRATGIDIEETTSDYSFVIGQFDTVHMEFLRVKRKHPPAEEQSSNQGFVSAASLNIPEKARKEFDKGLNGLDKKDYPEAQKHFEKAVAIYPKYAAALNNLGYVAMLNGQNAEGEAFFEKAIAADDQYPGAYLNLARVRWGQSRFDDAEKLLVKDTSLDPQNVEAICLLANVAARKGKYDEAITLARKVHTMPHEAFAVAHYIAGLSFQEKNQLNDAAVEFRQYLKEAPEGKSATNARTALANVEQRLAAR